MKDFEEPKKRYECMTCGALIDMERAANINTMRCCSNPDLKLILVELKKDNELEEMRLKLFECYNRLVEETSEYLDWPIEYSKLNAIWLIGTYLRQAFKTWPILYFNAMRGSGKTRVLSFNAFMGKNGNGKIVNNITEAVLFRHPKDTILCLDECEGISNKDKSSLREILNSNYKRGMTVKRIKKIKIGGVEQQVTETFEPDFPVCLANINGLEEVLSDRSITLILEKSNNPRITKLIEDFESNPILVDIKRTLDEIMSAMSCRVVLGDYNNHWNQYIKSKYPKRHYNILTYPTLPDKPNTEGVMGQDKNKGSFNSIYESAFNLIDDENINGRNFELLFPLLLTAYQINEDVFKEILEIGKNIIINKKDEDFAESKDISVYEFIAEHGRENEYVFLKDMANHFKLFVGENIKSGEEPWANEQWLGYALKRLKLVKSKKRTSAGRLFIVDVEKAKEKVKIFK